MNITLLTTIRIGEPGSYQFIRPNTNIDLPEDEALALVNANRAIAKSNGRLNEAQGETAQTDTGLPLSLIHI